MLLVCHKQWMFYWAENWGNQQRDYNITHLFQPLYHESWVKGEILNFCRSENNICDSSNLRHGESPNRLLLSTQNMIPTFFSLKRNCEGCICLLMYFIMLCILQLALFSGSIIGARLVWRGRSRLWFPA